MRIEDELRKTEFQKIMEYLQVDDAALAEIFRQTPEKIALYRSGARDPSYSMKLIMHIISNNSDAFKLANDFSRIVLEKDKEEIFEWSQKIDDVAVRTFIHTLDFQLDRIAYMFAHLTGELKRPEDSWRQFVILDLIDDIIDHSARVSQILFPSSKEAAGRGLRIRTELGISDDHLLGSINRSVRNYLQHFDEKIDGWLRRVNWHNSCQDMVLPFNIFGGVVPTLFRVYIVSEGRYVCVDESIIITDLVEACRDIYDKVADYNIRNNISLGDTVPKSIEQGNLCAKDWPAEGGGNISCFWPKFGSWSNFTIALPPAEIDKIVTIQIDQNPDIHAKYLCQLERVDNLPGNKIGFRLLNTIDSKMRAMVHFSSMPSWIEIQTDHGFYGLGYNKAT